MSLLKNKYRQRIEDAIRSREILKVKSRMEENDRVKLTTTERLKYIFHRREIDREIELFKTLL
jgi:hypothetical protein